MVVGVVDQLPPFLDHGVAGCGPPVHDVVRVVKEQGSVGEGTLPGQQRHEAASVEHVIRRRFRTRDLGQRRQQIDEMHEAVAARARRDAARPAGDERHADAALVEGALAFAKRLVDFGVALQGIRAVVAGHEEERVVGQALFIERSVQFAEALVGLGDRNHHLREATVGAGMSLHPRGDFLVGDLVRSVGDEGGYVEEEGLGPVLSFHEIGGEVEVLHHVLVGAAERTGTASSKPHCLAKAGLRPTVAMCHLPKMAVV